MRKFLSLFLSCLFVLLCGCENPIQGVTVGASPLGGFNVTVNLKGGGVMVFDNVQLDQLATMQKKYRISPNQVRWVGGARALMRDVSPCGDLSRAISAPSSALTIRDTRGTVLYDGGVDLVRGINSPNEIIVKPSLRERFRNVAMLRSPHYVRTINNGGATPVSRALANCTVLEDFTPGPAEPPSVNPPHAENPAGPGTNEAPPPSGEFKGPKSLDLESRVSKLEQRMDGMSFQVDGLRTDLTRMKDEILQAIGKKQ